MGQEQPVDYSGADVQGPSSVERLLKHSEEKWVGRDAWLGQSLCIALNA